MGGKLGSDKFNPNTKVQKGEDQEYTTTGASGELEGLQYGKLNVLLDITNQYPPLTGVRYLCKCECGRRVVARGYNLTNGRMQMCGECFFKKGNK